MLNKKSKIYKDMCNNISCIQQQKQNIFYGNDWQMLDVKVGTNIIAVSDHEF